MLISASAPNQSESGGFILYMCGSIYAMWKCASLMEHYVFQTKKDLVFQKVLRLSLKFWPL